MSMWLMYTKVSPDTLKEVIAKPALIEGMFFGEGEAPKEWKEEDNCELDYRTYSAVAEALGGGVEIYEQDTWTAKAVGQNLGKEIDFEFCYGLAFYFTNEEVKKIAEGMSNQGWDPDEVYEENVCNFFRSAGEEGKCVIGGVN